MSLLAACPFQLLNVTVPGSGIILVSFGTVTKGERIPIDRLRCLVMTFSKFPSFTFIWQLDLARSRFDEAVLAPVKMAMPGNVRLFPWVPLERLLGDPRVVLSINHGGISTLSEAAHHGVPVLGVALQGDQGFNLKRVVDRGFGEMLPASGLTEDTFRDTLDAMLARIDK